jgi:hypothetical protein
VSTVEQHVHSLLEIWPLTAALLLTALHWDQAAALAGRGRPGSACSSSDATRCRPATALGCWPRSRSLACCPTPKNSGAAGGPIPTTRPLPKTAFPATETLQISPEGDGIRSSR